LRILESVVGTSPSYQENLGWQEDEVTTRVPSLHFLLHFLWWWAGTNFDILLPKNRDSLILMYLEVHHFTKKDKNIYSKGLLTGEEPITSVVSPRG